MAPTPLQRLADYLLAPDGLEAFVRSRRADGVAWRIVERQLYETTNGEVDVTFETLRQWYPDRDEAVSA